MPEKKLKTLLFGVHWKRGDVSKLCCLIRNRELYFVRSLYGKTRRIGGRKKKKKIVEEKIKEGLRKPEGREIWAMSTANRILLWKTNY